LRGADVSKSNLSATKLTPLAGVPKGYDAFVPTNSTLLVDVDLSGAYLSDANLAGATLENVNLSNADISCSNFKGVQLTQVNLTHTIVAGANFDGILSNKTNFKLADHKDGGDGSCNAAAH
jgi:uncharacterized protein YjbI with pentapeptide repeats